MKRLSLLLVILLAVLSVRAGDKEAKETMRRATQYMMDVASYKGGFVWSYLPDYSRQWGELEAWRTMVWLQSPSTPDVGQVLLDAYHATGDEYYYDDMYESWYPADTEPWEPNLTTLVDFSSKWQDMLPAGTAIPTVADGKELTTKVGVYEGGGYQSKGVYRPAQECRMKVNQVPEFCPVCQRAIRRLIDFYTEQ